jgi:hypothetical protein
MRGEMKMTFSIMHGLSRALTRAVSLVLIGAMLALSVSSANARFISPDNLDPTMRGVGTNRYAYSGNDPVNKSDPNGHIFGIDDLGVAIGIGIAALSAFLGGTTPANAPGPKDTPQSVSDGRQIANMALGATQGGLAAKVAKDLLSSNKEKKKEATAADVADESKKIDVERPLKPEDLGLKGVIKELRGTIKVTDNVAIVKVDFIEAKFTENPLTAISNLSKLAKSSGATSLRIEGTLANPQLLSVRSQRYGVVTQGAREVITIGLK